MNRQNFAVIYNPYAGQKTDVFFQQCINLLVKQGAKVVIEACREPGHAAELARTLARSGVHDAIIACGGDGTIREIATGITGRDTPIGVIPSGTANLLAYELGIKPEPQHVVDVLLRGQSLPLYSGKANGHLFMLMCGVGFDAAVIKKTGDDNKNNFGKWAFFLAGFKNLLNYQADNLSLKIDQARFKANWIVATKTKHYGGSYLIDNNNSIFTPTLTAVNFQASNQFGMFSRLLSLGLGSVHNNSAIDHIKFRKAVITSKRRAMYQLDGDLIGHTPVEIEYGPIIHFITPKRANHNQTI